MVAAKEQYIGIKKQKQTNLKKKKQTKQRNKKKKREPFHSEKTATALDC